MTPKYITLTECNLASLCCKEGQPVYPQTNTDQVILSDGTTLTQWINNLDIHPVVDISVIPDYNSGVRIARINSIPIYIPQAGVTSQGTINDTGIISVDTNYFKFINQKLVPNFLWQYNTVYGTNRIKTGDITGQNGAVICEVTMPEPSLVNSTTLMGDDVIVDLNLGNQTISSVTIDGDTLRRITLNNFIDPNPYVLSINGTTLTLSDNVHPDSSVVIPMTTYTAGDGIVITNNVISLNSNKTQADWDETNTAALSYIKNKPTIPVVNDGTLTINYGTTTIGTFTANQSGNSTITIPVNLIYEVVSVLPVTDIKTNCIYLVPNTTNPSIYDEYMWINNTWELIGSTAATFTQTQSDWNQANVSAVDYIKNKPALSIVGNTITIGNTTITPLTSVNVVDNNPTLAYGTTSTIGTVQGTALRVTMPNAASYTAGDGININSSNIVSNKFATANEVGGIKIGYSGSEKPVELDANNQAFVKIHPSIGGAITSGLSTHYFRVGTSPAGGSYTADTWIPIIKSESQNNEKCSVEFEILGRENGKNHVGKYYVNYTGGLLTPLTATCIDFYSQDTNFFAYDDIRVATYLDTSTNPNTRIIVVYKKVRNVSDSMFIVNIITENAPNYSVQHYFYTGSTSLPDTTPPSYKLTNSDYRIGTYDAVTFKMTTRLENNVASPVLTLDTVGVVNGTYWNNKVVNVYQGSTLKGSLNLYSLTDQTLNLDAAAAQVQADWNQSDNTAVDYIKNKPTLSIVGNTITIGSNTITPLTSLSATDGISIGSGNVIKHTNNYGAYTPTWNFNYDTTNKKFVFTADDITSDAFGHVFDPNSTHHIDVPFTAATLLGSTAIGDSTHFVYWNGTTFVAVATPTFTQIQSDWNQVDNTAADYIKNKPNLATVATSGSYNDLTNTPTIPAAANNATITIATNNTASSSDSFGDFTVDASTAKTINIPKMKGADGTNAGFAGLVPKPSATDNAKFLKGDGNWSSVNPAIAGITKSCIGINYFRVGTGGAAGHYTADTWIPLIISRSTNNDKCYVEFEIIGREQGKNTYGRYFFNYNGENTGEKLEFSCVDFYTTDSNYFAYDDIVATTIKESSGYHARYVMIYKRVRNVTDSMFVVNVLSENTSSYSVQHYYYTGSSSFNDTSYKITNSDLRIGVYSSDNISARLENDPLMTLYVMPVVRPVNGTYWNKKQVIINQGNVEKGRINLYSLVDQTINLDAGSTPTLYNLTLQPGAFGSSTITYDPDNAAQTVNIPTTAAHIMGGSSIGSSSSFIYWNGTAFVAQSLPTIPTVNNGTLTIEDANGNTFATFTANDSNSPTAVIPVMQGATSVQDGEIGFVPKPRIADKDNFLKGDGTWATVSSAAYTAGDGIDGTDLANNIISHSNSIAAGSINSVVDSLTYTTDSSDQYKGKLKLNHHKIGWDTEGHINNFASNNNTYIDIFQHLVQGTGITITPDTVGQTGNYTISSNITLAGLMGNSSIGGPTSFIYWDGGQFDTGSIPTVYDSRITIKGGDSSASTQFGAFTVNVGSDQTIYIPLMVGASANAAGTKGLVPDPAAGDENKFLRGDGTWATAGGGQTVNDATINIKGKDSESTPNTTTFGNFTTNQGGSAADIDIVVGGGLKISNGKIVHINDWTGNVFDTYEGAFNIVETIAAYTPPTGQDGANKIVMTRSSVEYDNAGHVIGISQVSGGGHVKTHYNDWTNSKFCPIHQTINIPDAVFVKSGATITGLKITDNTLSYDNEGHIVAVSSGSSTTYTFGGGGSYTASTGIALNGTNFEHTNTGVTPDGMKPAVADLTLTSSVDPNIGWTVLHYKNYDLDWDTEGHLTSLTSKSSTQETELDIWSELATNVLVPGNGININTTGTGAVTGILISCNYGAGLTMSPGPNPALQLNVAANSGIAVDANTGAVSVNAADLDLSQMNNTTAGFQTSSDVATTLEGYVPVEAGKGLSTEDYTTAEKEKLGSMEEMVLILVDDKEQQHKLHLFGFEEQEG